MNRISALSLRTWCVVVLLGVLAGCGSRDELARYEQLRKQASREEAVATDMRSADDVSLEDLRRLFQSKQFQRVIDIAQRRLIEHPDDASTFLLAAKAHHALGQVDEAIQLLDAVENDADNSSAEGAILAARWLAEEGKTTLAIDRLTKYLNERPDSMRPRHRLVDLLNNAGRRMEAAGHVHLLIDADEVREKELFSLLNLSEAMIDESIPPPSFSALNPALLGAARRLRDEGKIGEALELAESLHQAFPADAAITAFFAKLLAESQQFERVAALAKQVKPPVSSQPEYWFAIGQTSLAIEQTEAAGRCFAEAIRRDPTDARSVLGLARTLAQLGETASSQRAMEYFQWLDQTHQLMLALGKKKGSAEQYGQLIEALHRLGRDDEASAWLQFTSLRPEETKQRFASKPLDWDFSLTDLPLPEFTELKDSAMPVDEVPAVDSSATILLGSVAASVGLDFQYDNGDDLTDDQFFLHQQTGGGIGVLDFDRDGWPDLYFTQAGGDAWDNEASKPNELVRNLEGEHFEPLAAVTGTDDRGYGQGVDVADFNQDGFDDLYVANIGRNRLLINNGDGTFRTEKFAGMQHSDWTTSVFSGDLDGDSLPEIIEVNYIDDPEALRLACVPHNDACGPSRFRPAVDRWLTVNTLGEIEAWSLTPKLDQHGHGFAGIITQLDNQPGNDVYIANDGDANFFFRRQTHFNAVTHDWMETAFLSGCASSMRGGRHGSMGLAFGDIDRNGLIDLHVTNYWDQDAELYLQRSAGIFEDSSSGWMLDEASKPTVGWGTQAFDVDLDGDLDLAVLNGHIVNHSHRGVPFKMLPQFFRSENGRFKHLQGDDLPDAFWSKGSLGRTLATLDFNRDGLTDLVAGHLDVPTELLRNETDREGNHWLQVQLVGSESERNAVGAVVHLKAGKNNWTAWVVGGGGFLCDNEDLLHFGLAKHEQIDELEVHWPSGRRQTFAGIQANQRLLIVEGHSWSQIGR